MNTQQTNESIDFVPLLDFNDYEILNIFPFIIRRKETHRVVNEMINNGGYKVVVLNGVRYLLHRLIALQFIPNDDPVNKYVVDHKNHNKQDNHFNNLR